MSDKSFQNVPLPVVDFAGFGDGSSSDAHEIGKRLLQACQDVGFAYLINTGISQAQVDDMLAWSRKFFSLPPDIKQLAPHPVEGWKQRGYSGIGVEQLSQMVFDANELAAIRKNTPDFKESFDLGRTDSPHLENIWLPEEHLPGFREAALSFYYTCRSFQIEKLFRALSLGLGLPADYLAQYHRDGDNQLRLLHYPAAPAEVFARGEKGRAKAHTDFGTATILFQDNQSGLEVESPSGSGQFIPVPPIPGATVFNVADLLMRWSNDTLKSTLHRVCALVPEDGTGMIKERYSIPFFMGPDVNALVECLPGCSSEDRPKKYEPITAAAYIDMRLNATYV
ncbi:flavonol synthase/flavanone 3-hydroxylase [Pisolithus marmoratus]|nr:flavonol synthase/flavanone 3-hydroxylase [Pisolithus marmoratus]